MNQSETKFCVFGEEDGLKVDIEGNAHDLTNLLANVIGESEEIEMVVTMALLAVHMQRNKAENGNNEAFLSEMIMNIKPKAQA